MATKLITVDNNTVRNSGNNGHGNIIATYSAIWRRSHLKFDAAYWGLKPICSNANKWLRHVTTESKPFCFLCSLLIIVLQFQSLYNSHTGHCYVTSFAAAKRLDVYNNDKRLCYCRGTARRATSVEILWPFLTELLTRISANPEEPCEHNVSWNRVKWCTNVRRIARENVCNRWMTFKVIQGHCRCHHLIGHILFPISLPL